MYTVLPLFAIPASYAISLNFRVTAILVVVVVDDVVDSRVDTVYVIVGVGEAVDTV